MRDLVFTMFVFGMLPICFYHARIGLMMWAWLGYMVPNNLMWGFARDIRFVWWVALVTLVGFVLSREVKLRIPWNFSTVSWLLFVLWCCVTTQFALHPKAPGELERFLKIQAMILIVFSVVDSRKWIEMNLIIIAVSFGYWGIKGGLFTIIQGGLHRVLGPSGGFIADNNSFALALLMTIPVMRYLHLQAEKRWWRWGMVFAMITTYLAIIGTYSRGGYVGLVAMTIALWMKGRQRIIMLCVLVLAVPLVLEFMPDKWHSRMDTIRKYEEKPAEEADRSITGRLNSWQFARNLVSDRPLVGGGFKAFNRNTFLKWAPNPTDFHESHSIYFQILGEQGYVGLLFFLSFYISCFYSGRWILRRTVNRPDLVWTRDLAAMIQVSLVAYASAGAFLGLGYFDLPYNLAALLLISREIVRKSLATPVGVAEKIQVLPWEETKEKPFRSIFDPGGEPNRFQR